VKLSTLLQIIGSGSVLMIVGVALVLFGAAYGFTAATGLPGWVSLLGLGLLSVIAGIALVDRGSDEAEEEIVKKIPLIDVLRSPYWILGASVLGGLILARLTRKRPVIVEHATVREIDEEPPAPPVEPPAKEQEGPGFSQFVSNHLTELGMMAGDMAINLGMKTLGIPSMKEFLDGLLGGDKSKSTIAPEPDPVQEEDVIGSETNRFSMRHAHNGAHRDDFDPMIR
jgi:hypothetical protein